MTDIELARVKREARVRRLAQSGELEVEAIRLYRRFVADLTPEELALVVRAALDREVPKRRPPERAEPAGVAAMMTRTGVRAETCSCDCDRPPVKRGMCRAHYQRWLAGRRGWELTRPIRGEQVPEATRDERVRAVREDVDVEAVVSEACSGLAGHLREDVEHDLWIRAHTGEIDPAHLTEEVREAVRRWHRENDGYNILSLDTARLDDGQTLAEVVPDDQWERAWAEGW